MPLNIKRSSRPYAISLLSALITFIVYLPSLQNDFVTWDDGMYIVQNEHIKSLKLAFFKWALTDIHTGNWHPLTWVSHAFDYAVWGLNPFGHHLTSILFHALNTFLVTLLAVTLIETHREKTVYGSHDRISKSQAPVLLAGIVTGLLFGLHPLHVESVAWISERKDVLYAFFFLLALLEYVRYVSVRDNTSSPYRGMHEIALRAYVSALLLFCLAAISKPMAVTFPAVLLIFDWFPLQRLRTADGRRLAFLEKIPFIIISMVFASIAFFAQKSAHAVADLIPIPLEMRIMNAAKALMEYLVHMVLPFDLLPLYPHPYWVDRELTSPQYLLPAIAVALISACSIILMKRQKLWFAVWASYVMMLLPVLGIIQVGAQGMADRYTYLPSVGPFLVMGLSMGWVGNRIIVAGAKKTAWAALMTLLCLLVILVSSVTVRQIHLWKDGAAMWGHELAILNKKASRDYFVLLTAHAQSGLAHTINGSYENAIDDFSKAILIKSDTDLLQQRAIAYAKLGRYEEAIHDLTSAISMGPKSATLKSATLYYNRGTAYAKHGSLSEAVADLSKAISLSPEPNADYFMNRGNALKKLGRLDEGERDILEAKKIRTRSDN